jgi:peptidoglycan/LPS O-acetylase OafA/YrhL
MEKEISDKRLSTIGYDVLRIISAFVVVSFHFSLHVMKVKNTSFGYFDIFVGRAVAIFFIVSGATLWLNNKDTSIKDFAIKRVKSIYPLFWICYVPLAIERIIKSKSLSLGLNPLKYILSIFGLDGYFLCISPNYYILGEWFLGAIIIIYVMFPLIRFCIKKNIYVTTFIILALYILTYVTGVGEINNVYNFFTYLFYFYVGILYEETKGKSWVEKIAWLLLVIVPFCRGWSDLQKFIQAFAFVVCINISTEFLYKKEILQNHRTVCSIIIKAGSLTYLVFLIHQVFLTRIGEKLLRMMPNTKLAYGCSVLCIVIFSYLINELFLKVKKTISRKGKV